MEELVSVIVPVYNVEKYLGKCLDSIISQIYTNLEIILVNDGSTDQSEKICVNYKNRDKRITYIYQTNAGSGPARNNGLKHAHGKFIVFVDPDDWIDSNLVSNLVSAQSNSFDLVLSGCTTIYFKNQKEKKRSVLIPEQKILEGTEAKQEYVALFNKGLIGSPTKKLYLKEIIDKHNLEFPDLRRSQDIVFNYRYFDKCNSVNIINYSGYFYRINYEDRGIKLKENYYLTINLIVKDVCALYEKWGIALKKNQMADTYVGLYIAALEANIQGRKDIINIVNDVNVRKIFETASCNRADLKLIQYLVLKKHIKLLSSFMKFRIFIKAIL